MPIKLLKIVDLFQNPTIHFLMKVYKENFSLQTMTRVMFGRTKNNNFKRGRLKRFEEA
jgi:hypothetical protein